MHSRQAVLGPVRGHAQNLDGAEVGRDEGQPGHPGWQRPPGQQEILARGDRPAGDHPDRYDQGKVDPQDRVVERVDMKPEQAAPPPRVRTIRSGTGWRKAIGRQDPSQVRATTRSERINVTGATVVNSGSWHGDPGVLVAPPGTGKTVRA